MKRTSLLALIPLMFLLLLSVVSVRPVWARATLENPQPNSSQSGIGVISGWACNANRIEIVFNETDTWQAGYGTRRTDTQGVCGDTNNGFGLLFNWNLLGDGTHTVRALADGVEFGSATVVVTTLGQEMLRGVSEAVTVSDFPTAGSNIVLRWQESQQNFVITAGSPVSGGTSGSPPRVLENPQPGSFQSGIGVISGWVCDANQIEIEFDNDTANRWQAGYGTRRTDTQGVCGDTDNGFGLLFNWNLLGNGTHTVRVLADGVAFANATVTVTTLGQEVLRGASKEVTLPDFPEVGADSVLQWQESQQNFVIAAAAPTQRLVGVYPDITIPTGVTSVRAGDVNMTSLSSPTGQVRASPDPTLLLAEDAGGTVLLSIANMDGGLLGEMGLGEVRVSLDSTAVTLVALAAGYPITAIDQSVVDQITAHANYPALLAAMKTALAADKNFLDRIFDYPEVVRLIRQVATFRAGVRQARQAVQQMHRMLSAQSVAVPPTGIYKDDFWCTPWIGWPCSPWDEHEPWQWFGDAKGVAHFYPDSYLDVIGGLLTGGVRLSVGAYAGILKEATAQPFLARSHGSLGLHATANPAFVDYAMELYSGDKYIGWYYTPRNSTVVRKLRNSGAAQRLLPTGAGTLLTQRIDRVRFERYRLSFDSEQATTLTFLNGFKAVMAAVNLFSDFSAVVKWLDGLPGDGEIVLDLAECVVDSSISRHIPKATSGDTVAPMLAFIRASANAWIDQLVGCPIGDLPALLTEQMIRSWADTAGLLTPYGWAKLAFDATNEAVPVFTSYLWPGAGSAEYFIDWRTDAAGNPYITRVSETPPDDKEPSAPDLVVESTSVSVNSLTAGQAFTLSATVRNRGTGASPGATLRYYRSSDAPITRQDTQLDTDWISRMNPSSSRTASANLTAPSTAGTYYYGACVDSVTDEADTTNNCSSEVRVTVEEPPPTQPSISKIYWIEGVTDTIQRANLDGSQVETPVSISGDLGNLVLDVAGGKMYWLNGDYSGGTRPPFIQRANLDGSQVETPVSVSDYIIYPDVIHDLVLDVAGGKMYWINGVLPDARRIQRANLDGSRVETLVSSVSSSIYDLVLDVARGKMYWLDSGNFPYTIQRANLDGSGVETLVSVSSPDDLVLDVAGGKMYWRSFVHRDDARLIQRANLDGSGVETLVSVSDPTSGLVLDVARGKMYWLIRPSGNRPDLIQRANLNGSGVETLVSVSSSLHDLVLDVAGGKMYWSNLAFGSGPNLIQRANLDGSGVETLVSGVNAYDFVLAITNTSRRSAITSQRSE